MLTGTCHCGAAHWTFDGDPGEITACNCTLCRRYGALWAYDYENQRIRLSGPTTAYIRADDPKPCLEILFCPTCGNVLAWRALAASAEGRRVGVNIRLAPPEQVHHLAIRTFDGLTSFQDLPPTNRHVHDLWC